MWPDLCVDQGVVEKDEPVDRKPPGVLQRQSLVAALTDEPTVRLPQGILTTHRHNIQGHATSHDHHLPALRTEYKAQVIKECRQQFTVILPGKLFQK